MAILFYDAHYAVFLSQMSSRSMHLSRTLLSVPPCLEKWTVSTSPIRYTQSVLLLIEQ